ncbi:MAG: sarcosine oxidase subunit delta [Gammaproteobacteria bacterium]|nr:sarcosine oxidase subunit delta [Gammaproteobacteria bacterium]
MQSITCPWCGPRAQTEFEYHCDASAVESRFLEESVSEALERVFIRDDTIGFHQEIWQHVLGCRGWFRLERHNRTHEIRGAAPCRRERGDSAS